MYTDQFFEQEIILEDEWVRLEPLEEKHFELLLPAAMEKSLWLFTVAKINSVADFKTYFDTAITEKKTKRSYPFAIYNKKQQQYAGSTRFGNIEFQHKKLEIGWTWIHPPLQGTGFNKHCKFLLLSFGFESLLLNRIELKTNSLNEGTLRKNIINDDGTLRDTVYFSFLAEEWPVIKNTVFKEFITA